MATTFTEEDFIPLDELVQQVSNSCAAAASVFEDLSEDLNAIHRFLEYLIKQANDPNSLLMQRCQDRRKDWLHILEPLTYAVCELQEHISTYYEVGPDIWLQADDAQRHFNNLRSEVMVGYDAVDTFVDSLGLSPAARKDYSLGQIEKLLVQAVREERVGTAEHGVTKTANGTERGLSGVQIFLMKNGIEEAEVERHDARTKQILIWVLANEHALTDIMVREELANEKKEIHWPLSKQEGESSGRAKEHFPPLLYEEERSGGAAQAKEVDPEDEPSPFKTRDMKSDKDAEELELTTVLVDRSRPTTNSRPSSVATSEPSMVEAESDVEDDTESVESEWELV